MVVESQYQPGEHVVVQLDNRAIVGKVIFCSLYYQDVICVAFDTESNASTETPRISKQSPIFYTAGKALRRISKRVGMSAVTVEQGHMTRRLVADRIWVLDCVEYPKSDPIPPHMDVVGHKLLLDKLNEIVSEGKSEDQ